MSKAKRRKRYAEKLRDELRKRWMRELQEMEQTKTRQVDLIRSSLNLGKA